ncbi:MAG: phosphatidate cytidylyltransferase [Acidobacteriota bacterium]
MKRIVSAAILVLATFVVTRYLPPVAFFAAMVALLILGVGEFCALASRRGYAPQAWAAMAGSTLLAYPFFDPRVSLLEVLTLIAVLLPLLSLLRKDGMEDKFGNLIMTLFPVLFLGLLVGFIMALRVCPGRDGQDLPFLLLMIVAAGDTGAYYGGRRLGRRLLAPTISPKKTWEGFLIGVVTAVVAALVARGWFMNRLTIADCVILGIALTVIGFAGDLVESSLKRWAGAKDSSGLIPGHGGILDRIDALLFAAPVLFYYHLHFMEGGLL